MAAAGKMIEQTFGLATLYVMRSWSPNAPSVVGNSDVEVMLLGDWPLTITQLRKQICICLSSLGLVYNIIRVFSYSTSIT